MTVEVLSENEVSVNQGRVTVKIAPVSKSDTEKEVSTTWGIEVRFLQFCNLAWQLTASVEYFMHGNVWTWIFY